MPDTYCAVRNRSRCPYWGRDHAATLAILVPTAHRLMRYRTMHYELTPR